MVRLKMTGSALIAVNKPHFTPRLSAAGYVTLLLGIACLFALILQGMLPDSQVSISAAALATGVIAVLILLDWQIEKRYGEKPPQRITVIAVLIHAVLVEVLTLIDGLTYTSIIYLTIPFPVFFLLGKRIGIVVSVMLFSWFTLKFMVFKSGWMSDPATMNTYLLFVISLILITAMALVVQQERANRQKAENLLFELEKSHARLALYAEQVAEFATTEERNRLARDIHDSLGHYLTVVGVQLEKAIAIYEDKPQQSIEAVRHAKRLTDQALTDVRQSVGTLRHDYALFMLRPALESLSQNLYGLALKVELCIQGDENLFSKQQLLALYRAVQEGLTNVQKHAYATQVDIFVTFDEAEARLLLQDNGIGIPANAILRGFGLRGVRERLEVVGGQLSISHAPQGGTQLLIMIPRAR